ncbi:hypothetical protein H6G06_21770 [Anabaena sphaerica FACHB-251]|uniref:Uncharacterized protein n=1 Tax=Anabaena sphaerica FACHB-251 TaxID=2692883 RepID=A0A927A3D1_9NOST|nr:hypothetical protein [Anabaena sphaerica]MBD2296031.1 hypothetical protein [Anabaena sphaerica FACHB-251]
MTSSHPWEKRYFTYPPQMGMYVINAILGSIQALATIRLQLILQNLTPNLQSKLRLYLQFKKRKWDNINL